VVCSALGAGGRQTGAGQQAMRPERGMLLSNIPLSGRIACEWETQVSHSPSYKADAPTQDMLPHHSSQYSTNNILITSEVLSVPPEDGLLDRNM
jgi:hypothetical protein